MARSAGAVFLVLLLSAAINAQENATSSTTSPSATAQPGNTAQESSGECAFHWKGPSPKAPTVVAGIVFDDQCKTVENARVILVGGGYIDIVTSNAAGEFVFLNPTPKFCSLIVEKDGFKTTYIYSIEIVQLKHTTLRVSLEAGPSTEANAISASEYCCQSPAPPRP